MSAADHHLARGPARRALMIAGSSVAALAVVVTVVAQSASGWDLTFHVTAGGGHSAEAPYAIDGVIGEAVAGHSSQDAYAIDSGFGALVAEKFKRFMPHLATDGIP